MHISGAHLRGHTSFPAAGAAAAAKQAEKLAADTRKKLFAVAEELDASASAESAWMIGAWAGDGQSGSGHNASGHDAAEHEAAGYGNRIDLDSETKSGAPPELALNQSAIAQSAVAGAQSVNVAVQLPPRPAAYPANDAAGRVERTPEGQQVSYWA